jgi:ubiquitin carboxyl-terminal hydrolase 34
MLGIITQIWDELVVNALIEAETGYFKKWFVKFSSKEAEHLIDKEVLCDFFFDKVKTLAVAKEQHNKSELLKTFTEIFFRLNLLADNIAEKIVTYEDAYTSMFTDTTKQTLYTLKCHPDTLVGIDAFWNLLMDSQDDGLAYELIEFLTKLYVPTEADGKDRLPLFEKYIQAFVDRCSSIFKKSTSTQGWQNERSSTRMARRAIELLTEIVDCTESLYNVDNTSLASLYKGDKVNLAIDNNVYVSYDSVKKIDMKVFGNTTLLEVKKKLAAELSRVSWRNITLKRLNKKPDIKEKHNLRTLRDLRIKLGERLTASSKPIIQRPQEPLVLNEMLNPKAVMAFKSIFKRFEKGGFMGPEEVVGFASIVLDQKNMAPDDSKVKDLIGNWDRDKDGKLSEDEFFEFLKTSSFNKPSIVWSNLGNLGFGPDLLLKTTEESYCEEDLARHYLIQDEDLLTKMFSLMEANEELGSPAWELFTLLPPIPKVVRKILFFEGIQDGGATAWEQILDTKSAFKTLYSLYILDYLIEDNADDTNNKTLSSFVEGDFHAFKVGWRNQFVKLGGFVHLVGLLTGYIKKGLATKSDTAIFSFLMKSVANYVLASVTITKPDIYRNITFISNPIIPLKVLIKGKIEGKQEDPTVEKMKEILLNKSTDNELPLTKAGDLSRFTEESQQGVVYGPELPPHLRTNQVTQTETKAETNKTESESHQHSRLVESADFIQFRDTLKSINDDSISKLNLEETLRFVANLCEDILSKSAGAEFEDINMIKLGLTVFFSLLLSDPGFLTKAVLSQDIKLLSPESTFRIQGFSDLVSFLLAGLLTKRHGIFSRYFNNAFTVVMRESGSKEVQGVLVQAVLGNLMRNDLSSRHLARYIDLACMVLEGVCSEEADPKMLIAKADLNSITNLQTLFFYTLDSLLLQAQECNSEEQDSNLIVNHFKLLEKLLQLEPKLKLEVSKRPEQRYLARLFSECLFAIGSGNEKAGEELLCRQPQTRAACYDFIAELTRQNVDNAEQLVASCLAPLSARVPLVSTWRYTPNKDRRSDQGFLGIVNLHNICYANSMIQQLYMTPAFRYGILAADDQQEISIIEDKDGRKIDDNVFHQLQKMFAYLDGSERGCYHPYDFFYSFKDHGGQPLNVSIQQDTQEFFNIFFDRIENAIKETPFKHVPKDVFGGKTVDVLTCSSCGHLRKNEQVFYNLSLEVKHMKNFKESLDKLTTEDTISDYKCEHCDQRCDVTKRPLIKECPNVLIVYLSRLIFDLDVLQNVKINTRYEFPLDMNLKEYTYDHFKQQNPNIDVDSEVAPDEKPADGIENEKMIDELEKKESQEKKEKPEQASEKASVPVELSDEDFEYTLAGILVHRGHAEGGHYYSYININRHDPKRPKK